MPEPRQRVDRVALLLLITSVCMLYALASKSLLRVELSDDGHECVYDDEKKLYNLRSFSFHLFHILFCSHSQ